ncbi:hypothetical protein PCASD_18313 [Puccinia coronata f. sp. avenae]|uniref:histone acetyltransferase n=1 Tax=Puccinia coronata f. sp. avenae TaxID=200324 RepID=A0A2N5S7K4_9BASI|nr:hypothetical protein PCASD_18313 [Puccinia coronata f. sp. avenae]
MTQTRTLHESLYEALEAVPTHATAPRTFELLTLTTKPFRTHTLFPHAQDPRVPIMRTDYLVMLAEKFADYRRVDHADHNSHVTVPVFAIEASLYSLSPSSSSSSQVAAQLLYVSKIDSTGLAPTPAPAARLTIAFLAHFLHHHAHRSGHGGLRIHVFARAAREGQYLFPASAENRPHGPGDGAKFAASSSTAASLSAAQASKLPAGKRILDDQQLVKWWHTILSRLHLTLDEPKFKANQSLQAFYILPGFDYEESLQVLPLPSEYKPLWTYGHPYGQVPPPFAPVIQKCGITQGKEGDGEGKRQGQGGGWKLSELIPAFNDDPKARFLHSIGNCSTSPSGEPGDWDDAVVERSPAALENDRARERARINQVLPDEFWHRMGGRQECCDGHVSAFFVICSAPKSPSSSPNLMNSEKRTVSQPSAQREDIKSSTSNHAAVSTTSPALQEDLKSSTSNGAPTPAAHTDSSEETHKHLVGVPRNVWVSLWSKIHNKDYSKLENLSAAYSGWIDDVRSSIQSAILEEKQRRDRKLSEKREKKKRQQQPQDAQDDGLKEKHEEISLSLSSPAAAADRHPATRRGEEKGALAARFEDCFSVVSVHNSLLQDLPGARNGNLSTTDTAAAAGSNKRAPVNTLQPRKKPKK